MKKTELLIAVCVIIFVGGFLYLEKKVSTNDNARIKNDNDCAMKTQEQDDSCLNLNNYLNEILQLKEAQKVVNNLIPHNTFLRDFEKIPETDKYLGIYVANYEFIEECIGCFGYYGNLSLAGDYYFFLFENGKITRIKEMPKYELYPDMDIDIFKLTYLDHNNEVEGIINFEDYTGDGLKHQFLISGYYLPGIPGSWAKLIAGYNLDKNELEVYTINSDIYWLGDYMINNQGEIKRITQECHFNNHCDFLDCTNKDHKEFFTEDCKCIIKEDKEIFDHYFFNAETKSYNYSHQTEDLCPVF